MNPGANRRIWRKSFVAVFALAAAPAAFAAETNSVSPVSNGNSIRFDRDVRPIFEQNCFQCHGPEKPKSSFRLDNRADALRGGDDNQNDIVPGRSGQSKLIAYVAGLDKDIRMPPPDHGPPLSSAQVGTLRAWIDQGANWGTNAAPSPVVFFLSPVSAWIGVSGDNQKFRELEGVQEGWSGGANHFSFNEQLAPDEKLTIEGHALVPQNDFKVTVALDKKDSGFVHSGFEEWRRYYDDTGGYYPLFTTSSFSLNQNPHLDIGRAWIDFGLTLPDSPQLVFGYEYQFRQGGKSTLVWGMVNQGGLSKNIYPNIEDVDEHTHIFKVDLTREWDDWSLEDRVRAEFYHLSDQRNDVISYTTGPNPDLIQRVNQDVQYSQGANTFRIQRQIYDWWRASLGSLVSVFNGTSSFNENTTDGSGAAASGSPGGRRASRCIAIRTSSAAPACFCPQRIERFRLRAGRVDAGKWFRQCEPGFWRSDRARLCIPFPAPRARTRTGPPARKISTSGSPACRGRFCLPRDGCNRKASGNQPIKTPAACPRTTFSNRRTQ